MGDGSVVSFSPTVVQSSVVALAGLVVVCLASRMSMPESAMGTHSQMQITHVAGRIAAEAQIQADMSRQDTNALIALLHNVEATTGVRAAKRLHEESGVPKQELINGYLGMLCDLAEEQDSIVRVLLERIGE